MLKLKRALIEAGIAQAALARDCGVSPATIAQIVNHDQWPKNALMLEKGILHALQDRGLSVDESIFRVADECCNTHQPDSNGQSPTTENEMLTEPEWLSPAAKRHFKLARDPFHDDVNEVDDIYLGESHAFALAAMRDALRGQRFVAVVGESGAGKSTAKDFFIESMREEQVTVITPYVTDIDDVETRGRIFKSTQIHEAILRTLAPRQSVPRTPEARQHRSLELLLSNRRAGFLNLLLIEEAHALTVPVLKHLKRFWENKDGLQRLLGIVLIGQPELLAKLDIRLQWDAREAIQRIERAQLLPIDATGELEGYLRLKCERALRPFEQLCEPDVPDAIRQVLVGKRKDGRGGFSEISYCYPLAVNNLMTKTMNFCARIGIPKVGGEQIRKVMGA
ncbi:AAA family ATPase [Methylococcus mesophilus]|uniref:AAA family ATPase n=1 Tax=Methylococcus mesophilus TaxID=2993564 RepID=UPI00224B8286|nr:AAA family ATPase [Methylococcus mesophilus]UZR27455.1 AAA family ATPase [Methylococcus mesophilus]